ncbi:MAG: PQQ-binding-like beta-propeller repeat protein [Paracoccaceae bacterium]
MVCDVPPARGRIAAGLGIACAALLLAACSREEILPGDRIPVRPPETSTARAATKAVPIRLPKPVPNAMWSHKNGTARHRIENPALSSSPRIVWVADIGSGNSRRERIVAAPVVDTAAVYTMDSQAGVTAVSLGGKVLWRVSLVPEGERADEGIGGGLALDGSRLFAATGFGEVFGLSPKTGEVLWRRELEAPVRSAPAAAGGRVYVVSRDDVAYGLDADSGDLLWRVPGAVGGTGFLGGASPAIRGPLVVVPFSSGEVVGILGRNGLRVWSAAVSGGRRGLVRALVGDISSDPVIDWEGVYAANQGGRMVSLDRRSGDRNWTISEGAVGPVWPVAGSVFLVSDRAEVMRLDAATGERIWSRGLTEYKTRRRRAAIAYYGPVLAGGRLYVAGADGLLRVFDPGSGATGPVTEIPGGAAAAPAVANGMMFIVSGNGKLYALK